MNKRIWLGAGAGLLIAVAAVLLIGQKTAPAAPTRSTASASAQTGAETTLPPTTQAAQSEASQTEPLPTETEAPVTEAPETRGEPQEQTEGEVETRAPEIQTEPPRVEPPAPTETETPWLEFPIRIPEYDLEIEAVHSYDGIYLEDGSDTPISGVAAIMVTNHGDRCVDLATLQLSGEKTGYTFRVTGLGAGASAVVMETGKAPAVEQRYTAVSADVAQSDSFEMSEEILSVEEEDDALKVTNLSDRDIPCVRIFYKFYLEDAEAYVGGITYTAKLLDLKAGASVTVRPSHYAVGSSRVIMAKIYDTDLE